MFCCQTTFSIIKKRREKKQLNNVVEKPQYFLVMFSEKEEELRKATVQKRKADLESIFEDIASQKRGKNHGVVSGDRSAGGGKKGICLSSAPGIECTSTGQTSGTNNRVRGGGVLITAEGRTIILSSENRNMPKFFTDFQRVVRTAEQQLATVSQTAAEVQNAFSSASQLQLPHETVSALKESHQEFLYTLTVSRPETFSKHIGAAKVAKDPEREEEWNLNVLRARSAAADEGFVETQSVDDYAMNDLTPLVSQNATIREQLQSLWVSLQKVDQCAQEIIHCEQATDVPWWSSASRTRHLKANTIRTNFHSRLAYRLNLLAGEELYRRACIINMHSDRCHTDLLKIQHHLGVFEKRTQENRQQLAEVERQVEQLSLHLEAALERRATLQKELVETAHYCNILPFTDNDVANVELALLLQVPLWPKDMMPDVLKVLQWIKNEPCTLEL